VAEKVGPLAAPRNEYWSWLMMAVGISIVGRRRGRGWERHGIQISLRPGCVSLLVLNCSTSAAPYNGGALSIF
jgi:hypothetical protein